MASWLYAASGSKASASRTFELAKRHGIVWRSYYANRRPLTPIPNVKHLRSGDLLYLGYRHQAAINLLGRMRIVRPDVPLQQSPVFGEIPEALVPEFEMDYGVDPILDVLVGIFVDDVAQIFGRVASPGRLSLTEVTEPFGSEEAAIAASLRSTRERGAGEVYVGIDVGGRPSKGYDLCGLTWSYGVPSEVSFERLPHSVVLPPTSEIRPLVAAGAMEELARVTHDSASEIARTLWSSLVRLAGGEPAGVFIDAPSAFSRNRDGHGRLTEKASLPEVSFQSSPSSCSAKEHRGDWGWLVYGVVAFAACLHRGPFSLREWTVALESGLYRPTMRDRIVIREIFPTATIAALRRSGRSVHLAELLRTLQDSPAVAAVLEYLERGVRGVKRPGAGLYDQADALVAALSSVAHVRTDFGERENWPEGDTNWSSGEEDAATVEGAISLIQ